MAIIRWDPFRDLLNLQEKMNRLFEDSIIPRQELMYSGSWIPPVDIYETDDEIVLRAEVPGLNRKSIKVELDGNRLSIKGERKLEKGLKEENYHRIERSHGVFQRTFSLPTEIVYDNVNAAYQNGVLEIKLPKTEGCKSKQFKVKIS